MTDIENKFYPYSIWENICSLNYALHYFNINGNFNVALFHNLQVLYFKFEF